MGGDLKPRSLSYQTARKHVIATFGDRITVVYVLDEKLKGKLSRLKDLLDLIRLLFSLPIPMAARYKAWDCGGSLVGLRVRILRGYGCLSLVIVVCQVEVSATVRSPVHNEEGLARYGLLRH
jgi:hypothetical protein